jgi:hypothetical protein
MQICVVDCSYFLSFIMPDEKKSEIDLARLFTELCQIRKMG